MRLGYFSQHHVEHLVLARTPLEHLIYCFPDADHAVLRGHLSNIGIKGEMALRPIFTLSGGQKSRVALAVITFKKPHILALDEPTNHCKYCFWPFLSYGLTNDIASGYRK